MRISTGPEISNDLPYIARSQFLWPTRLKFCCSRTMLLDVFDNGFWDFDNICDFSKRKLVALTQAQCFTAVGLGSVVL